MFFYEDSKKIGIGLILLGLACQVIGVMMFLDRGFLVIGNISFIMGIVALIGPVNAFGFFTKKSKMVGSFFYFLGITMIIIGWKFFTIGGFLMQIYGIFLLFRSFLSTAFAYMQTLPIIGPFLRDTPAIHKIVNNLSNGGS